MGRSGKFNATNDHLIELLIDDPLYDIRRDGSIWTLITSTGKLSTSKTWRRCGSPKTSGYWQIKYGNKTIQVHRVIFRKFIGNLSPDLVINHIDGDPGENKIENLELVTQGANNLHRFRVMGHAPVIGNKKISPEIAQSIRDDRVKGLIYKDLMAKYGLCKSTISYVCNNRTWKSE